MRKWAINQYFRAVYRLSGNGTIERNHRTMKAMVEKGQVSPTEVFFGYNTMPQSNQVEESVPQRVVFQYKRKHSSTTPADVGGEREAAFVQIRDEVWVKPPNVHCTS